MKYDLLIKNGLMVDGTEKAPAHNSIAIQDGKIAAIGKDITDANRIIDAKGNYVIPGWVDIHTHYDGQALWDPLITPSSYNGVTTAIFGNCGVGFAPVRPGKENYLINLMEGVEDIPGSVLADGINFNWESFPEYLDSLDSIPRVMDIGAQVPHAALRFYVMGDDGAKYNVNPNDDQIQQMSQILESSLLSGALGFSTSRTTKHRAADGSVTPTLSSGDAELMGLAKGMKNAGLGVIQCNSDMGNGEMNILINAAKEAQRPLSVLLIQYNDFPERWRETLKHIIEANKNGYPTTGQIGSRPIGVLMGFETSLNPFSTHNAWKKIKHLGLEERTNLLQNDKSIRKCMLLEKPKNKHTAWVEKAFNRTYILSLPLDYEPLPEKSILNISKIDNVDPWEIAYDTLANKPNEAFLMHTFENYTYGNLDVIQEMLESPYTICGVGDGGAHVATICDASYPTFMLPYWSRDRKKGKKFSIEYLISKQTKKTANTYGLYDRGSIEVGKRADINIIDYDCLSLDLPELVYDLPSGGKRFIQKTKGYKNTFVNGVETMVEGEFTGLKPGRLIRSNLINK